MSVSQIVLVLSGLALFAVLSYAIGRIAYFCFSSPNWDVKLIGVGLILAVIFLIAAAIVETHG